MEDCEEITLFYVDFEKEKKNTIFEMTAQKERQKLCVKKYSYYWTLDKKVRTKDRKGKSYFINYTFLTSKHF